MAGNNYKVLITASGLGQRLGDLTKYTNKSLIRIGKKPALSYIIETYPKDVPLVITLGHFGEHVKDFVHLAYPDREVEFVEVDKYEGEGSSLGYSMLCAKDHLQCPFIYHASDTIVDGDIPPPNDNWIGVCKGDDAVQYASWKVLDDKNLIANDKGATDFDCLHIGLNGIKDYEDFWKKLEELYKENPTNSSLGDFPVLTEMLKKDSIFKLIDFPSWIDIGNVAALNRARKNIGDHFDNLDKIDEAIYIFADHVVKFFCDENIVKNRVIRADILKEVIPKIENFSKNFYRYSYVDGELYSRVVTPRDFKNFLNWAKNHLWQKVKEVDDGKFKQVCYDFYYKKTLNRINKFLEVNSIDDKPQVINGEGVPLVQDILSKIDFDWLSSAEQRTFHGDFILDNILKIKNGIACLIGGRISEGY